MIAAAFLAGCAILLAAETPSPAEGSAPDPYANDACVICHRADPKTAPIHVEWTKSVHFGNNVACSGCHGGDPTVAVPDPDDREGYEAAKRASHRERNPEFLILHATETYFQAAARGRSVSYFCGRCHTEIMEKHLGSPHGDFGSPTCLYCHAASPDHPGRSTHAIGPATSDTVDTRGRSEGGRCSPCHAEAAMKSVAAIKELLLGSEASLERAARDHAWLLAHGYRYLGLGEMVDRSRETRTRVRVSFHSFNMREIQEACRAIDQVAKFAESAIAIARDTEEAKEEQTLIAVAVSLLLLTLAGILVAYRHRYCGHAGEAGSPVARTE